METFAKYIWNFIKTVQLNVKIVYLIIHFAENKLFGKVSFETAKKVGRSLLKLIILSKYVQISSTFLYDLHYTLDIVFVCISWWSNGFVGLNFLRKAYSSK